MNFRDAYKLDMDSYSSSTSVEKLKEYERKEERRRDRKALPILLAIIFTGLLCWWLSSERVENISNTYEGFIVQAKEGFDRQTIDNPVLKIEGAITYDDKIFNDIAAIDIVITLEDSSGKIHYNHKHKVTVSDSDDMDFMPLAYWNYNTELEEWDSIVSGYLFFTENFEEIVFVLGDNEFYFAGPAKSEEEAMKILRYWFPMV